MERLGWDASDVVGGWHLFQHFEARREVWPG
jgi:hypothetical protein